MNISDRIENAKLASPLHRLRSFLNGNRFACNVLKLAGGTALGQGLVVVFTPVITRLYSPAEMGVLGVFMAFVGFLSVGVGLRYEMAIVSAKDDREANHLLVASLFFAIPTSMFAGFAMWIMIRHDLLSYGALPMWSAIATVIALLVTGIFTALRYWYVRRADFAGVSQALVSQGFGRAVVPIALAWGQAGWIGLLVGEIAGRSLGIVRLLRGAVPAIVKAMRPFDRVYYRSMLKDNWKFPAVVLPSSLIDSLAAMLPLPVLAFYFGPAAAGQFLLVQRLSQLPAGLVSASVGDVFHSHLSDAYRSDPRQVRAILWTVTKKLGTISTLIYLPLAIVAPFIFGTIFGQEWSETGLLVSILAPVSLLGMVVSPMSRLLFVVNRSELKLVIDGVRLFVPIFGLWVMHDMGCDFWYSVTAFSLLSSLNYILYFGLIWYASGKKQARKNRE
ncbi:MAG: oligosaccharide flippase family protein [Deltaproteobacteria bacterium]|nr:oligosaccharide flippase family protein [Deltaproteobacteria bacterium]